MSQLDKYFSDKIEDLKSKNLLRTIRNYPESLVNFSSNDYLGLLNDETIKIKAKQAIDKLGVGSGASRLVTGNSNLYDELESEIASYYKKPAACVFSSGYAANIGVIPTIVGKGDLIIADKFSHSCIIEGAQLSGAKFLRFNHNDYLHLEKILNKNRVQYNKCLVITEAVFSMDGDRADISKINKIAKNHNAWTYADYAHEITYGDEAPDIVMGTFSKAFASLGGYICGSEEVVKYIKTKSKSLIYSTALPPSVLVSSLEAVKIFKKNKNLSKQALENAEYFCSLLNLPKPQSQIVPIIVGEEVKALSFQKKLEEKGFIVSAIRPPTVPEGTSRLRFSFSASHTKERIENLAKTVKELRYE